MMPVKDLRARRLQNRAPPPGFKTTPLVSDGNNNAEKEKKVPKLSFGGTVTFLKSLVSSKTKREKIPKQAEPEASTLPKQANCEYYVDTVGDERVIVNKQEIGEDESEIEIDNTKTPEDYAHTCDYFFHASENRKDIMNASRRLGEMLIFRDIEGDIDDWAIYSEKADLETAEWKRRCRKSNAYFEKTGRVLGVDEKTLKYKLRERAHQITEEATDYLRRLFLKAKEVCPCFGKVCPCVNVGEVNRVRSIYSASWHWDEPVPD